MQRSISRRKREYDEEDEDMEMRYLLWRLFLHWRFSNPAVLHREEDRKRPLVKNDSEDLDPNAMET